MALKDLKRYGVSAFDPEKVIGIFDLQSVPGKGRSDAVRIILEGGGTIDLPGPEADALREWIASLGS
jgi:hypothetical protein